MPLSIHLDQQLETELLSYVQHKDIDLSEFVSYAIKEKLAKTAQSTSPYELGKSVFGRYASGETQHSCQRKQLLRKKIYAQHRSG